jgi:hypothetical protein
MSVLSGQPDFVAVLGRLDCLSFRDRVKPFSDADLAQLRNRFAQERPNFETFLGTIEEGALLARLLSLTSSRSFLDQTLERVKKDAQFSNMFANLLHGHDTFYTLYSTHLPWVSIYISEFLSRPIAANLEQINEARASMSPLADLAVSHREIYDGLMRGVITPDINPDGSLTAKSLSIQILNNGEPVGAQTVPSSSSTINVGDAVYYNGLPGDRAKYPTCLLPEGSQIGVKLKNTGNDVLMLMPTINGIPFQIEYVNFDPDGFDKSAFPVKKLEGHRTYLKPGEEVEIKMARCNRMLISDGILSTYDGIEQGFDMAQILRFVSLSEGTFLRQLDESGRTNLKRIEEDSLRQNILTTSVQAFLVSRLKKLKNPIAAPIFMSKPEIADGKRSSELANPMLGSIGINIVRVDPPVEKARHDVNFGSLEVLRGGAKNFGNVTRGLGAAGLGHISAGADISAQALDRNWSHDSGIHRFVGFVPINLMSLRSR